MAGAKRSRKEDAGAERPVAGVNGNRLLRVGVASNDIKSLVSALAQHAQSRAAPAAAPPSPAAPALLHDGPGCTILTVATA
eukprot:1807946-Rhodomonas_salina.1